MNIDSGPVPLDQQRRKRLSFDPTINAGHVLTFVTLVVAGFGAWSMMDKRVTVLEEAKVYQRERDGSQDAAIKEKFDQIKESLAELKQEIRRGAAR